MMALPRVVCWDRDKNIATAPRGAVAIIVVLCTDLLAGSNCTCGANISAGTAVQTGIGVDLVDVAFDDGTGGAF